MTWIPLLLADPSPSLRILVLKNLLNKSEDDEEVKELREIQMKDPLIEKTLESQLENGSWEAKALGSIAPGGNIQTTSQELVKLAYLEYPKTDNIISPTTAIMYYWNPCIPFITDI